MEKNIYKIWDVTGRRTSALPRANFYATMSGRIEIFSFPISTPSKVEVVDVANTNDYPLLGDPRRSV